MVCVEISLLGNRLGVAWQSGLRGGGHLTHHLMTRRIMGRRRSSCGGDADDAALRDDGHRILRFLATLKQNLQPPKPLKGKPASLSATKKQKQTKPQKLFLVASNTQTEEAEEKENKWKVFAGNLAAGAVAGCTVEAVLYPIDTIKTRLQMMRSGGGLKALFQGGGSGRLYSGIWGNLVGVGPATALFFGVYEPFKKEAAKVVPVDAAPLVAGAMAGIVSSVIRVPTEVVKQRMQTGQFTSAIAALTTIARREGVKGLFAGYNAFLLRDMPFDAIEFAAYEALKSAYSKFTKRRLNAAEAAATGAVAGGFTGLVTTPFDVLKTRLMTQGSTGQYDGLVDAIRKIATEEGAGAFFKGWQARLLWISVGGCVFFAALEQARNVFVPSVVHQEHEAAQKST